MFDSLWNYPDKIFPYLNSLISSFLKLRPFSYIIIFIVIFPFLGALIFNNLIKPPQVQYLDTLKVGFLGSVSIFNPYPLETLIDPLSTSDRFLNKIILDRLVDFDTGGNLTTNLASNFTSTPDFKTFTFNLKTVKWSDGYIFNADDVIKSYNLIKSETNGLYFTSLKDVQIKKTGTLQVEFDLNKGNSFFPETLIWPIVPSHVFSTNEAYEEQIKKVDYRINPITTSQWVISNRTQNSLTLIKNKLFNRNASKFSSLEFNGYENKVDIEDSLKSNDINLYLANESQSPAQSDERIKQVSITRQHYGVYFNFSDNAPAWEKDQNIRQALAYAVNQQALLNGIYAEVNGPLPSISPFYYPDINKYSYDPALAASLLSKSGYVLTNGVRIKDNTSLKITISVQNNTARTSTARLIQKYWQDLGILVDINYVEDSSIIDGVLHKNNFSASVILPKKFDVVLYGVESPPGWDRFSLWHSVDTKNSNTYSNNIGNYKNTKVDIDLENARLDFDLSKRTNDFYKFQKVLNDDVPVIFLYSPNIYIVYSTRVENISLTSINSSEDFISNLYDLRVRK